MPTQRSQKAGAMTGRAVTDGSVEVSTPTCTHERFAALEATIERGLPAAQAFFRRTITSTDCVPEHIVTDKATFYPSAIRTWAPDAKHTATGFYNRVISTNRCERNLGYLKSRLRPMRGLKSVDCAKHLFRALDAMQLIERGLVAAPCTGLPHAGGRSYVRAHHVASIVNLLGERV